MTGIVLKEMPLGESDKLLTVFSQEQGRISVVAKGAKKPGSRFLAAASAFAYSDMELVKGRSMYVMRNANIISSFYGLREDLDILTAAAEIARITLKVIQEELPDPETLELLLKALTFLEQKKRSPRLVAAVFTIRLLCIQGMIADLNSMDLRGAFQLKSGTRAAFNYICTAPDEKLFAFKVSDEVEQELYERGRSLCEHILLS